MSITTPCQTGDIPTPFLFDYTPTNASRHFLSLQNNGDARFYRIINIISPAQFYVVLTILHRGLVNILCIWGLFGNVVTVIVLIKQRLKDTINILLTSIAVFDFVFCATQLLQEAIIVLKEYDPVAGGKFLIIYMQGIIQWNHLALSSSIYSVAIIGVERLIAVCFPFLVARICTPYRTKCLIVLTELFIFTFTFPEKFLFYEYQWQNNQTVYTVRSWATSANTHAMFYWVYLMPMVQVILPLCLLTGCYAVIVVMLRSSSSKSSKLTPGRAKSSKAKELKMFRLLMTLMTVALLSFSPSVLFSLTLSYGVLFVDLDHYSFELLKILTKVCCHVFTSVNFIIYVTMSSKFAKSYSKLMKCCLPGTTTEQLQNTMSKVKI